MTTVAIPNKAAQHALDLLDADGEPAERALLEGAELRRRGKGYQRVVEVEAGDVATVRALVDRLRDWAEVERTVRSGGDGADSSVERACDAAADRLEAAVDR